MRTRFSHFTSEIICSEGGDNANYLNIENKKGRN